MIGFLRGHLMSLGEDGALIDVSGVGYEVLCSGTLIADLWPSLGKDITLWIHTHVREDALQLFGFASKAEKEFFLSLLKVNGVGPKMALGILSGGRFEQIMGFIEGGEVKALSSLPRVGKKTAEQIVLTLQGKLIRADGGPKGTARTEQQKQIQTALLHLGFKSQKVDEFLSQLPKEIDVEEGVRRGLTALSNAI